jgi:hypothetical protein
LDEPDAYLQPDQARRLGTWIGEQAAQKGIQVFVTTRNPSFLSGLFAGSADVSIIRISRRNDTTRFDLVQPEIGVALARFPLFAAQNAVRCLFQDGLVVVPEEADRIIYATVAERLLSVRNVGFLHTHGARNLAFVARLMRRANLPTCVVADLDLLQAGPNFGELVKAMAQADVPAPWLATRDRLVSHVEGRFDESELSTSTTEVEDFLDRLKQGGDVSGVKEPPRLATRSAASKWDRLRSEKLGILPPELRVWVEELLDEMKRIGIFVSPQGRMQGWMDGAAASDKEIWFNRAIQGLDRGECSADLRAFVAEFTAFVRASAGAPRPASGGNRT